MKLFLFGLGLFWVAALYGQENNAGVEAHACFDWFKTLGYPDMRQARWAKIWNGVFSQSGGNFQAMTRFGFVTRGEGEQFSVLYGDLTSATLTKTKPGEPVYQQVAFEEQDFDATMGRVLGELRNPQKQLPGSESVLPTFATMLDRKTEVFVFAFVCDQKGKQALANALFQEAKKQPSSFGFKRAGEGARGMKVDLEMFLAHYATWRGILLIGGSDFGTEWGSREPRDLKSRKELLEYFQELPRRYEHNPHADLVKKTTEMLERMVKEDERHVPIADVDLAKLPEEAQVKEWISRLRDQNRCQPSPPGSCDIFGDFGVNRGGTSPAHQLVALGYGAVPQLIEALGDEHLTRSVGFCRAYYFPQMVLTVGDCAEQILQRIAGQDFDQPASSFGSMSRDQERAATKKRVSEWWQEFQKKGERAMLVDTIASGTKTPDELVELLRAKYPDAVDDAVLRGAAQATDERLTQRFIYLVGQMQAPAATELLLKQFKEGKTLGCRVSAGEQLVKREHPEAMSGLLAEWQKMQIHSKSEDLAYEQLMSLLIRTGKSEALAALIKDTDQLGVPQRLEVIHELGNYFGGRHAFGVLMPGQAAPAPAEPAARESVEGFLVHELEDTTKRTGMTGCYGDFVFTDPRLCDFALWALHNIDPQRYAFSAKAPERRRDTERIMAANLWRKDHQQPLLEVPDLHLSTLSEKDSLKISFVRLTPSPEKADEGFAKDFLALKDQTLTTAMMLRLLKSFAQDKQSDNHRLSLVITRDEDLTGVRLEVVLTEGHGASPERWDSDSTVTVDRNNLLSQKSHESRQHFLSEKSWRDPNEVTTLALQSPPTTPFVISISLGPESSR